MSEQPDEALPDRQESSKPQTGWFGALALALAAVTIVAPLATVGIWDPHELAVAEPARRLALNLFHGGSKLALEGLDNSMPTRGVLGRGELPFTSIALGFRCFGLYEWAGRLPLALWGVAGIGVTYWLASRLAGRRVAAFSALALCTMPLYFLQARTMLGDIVTMAAYAGAYAGFGVAIFDRERSLLPRALGFLLGLGALSAGFLSRGVLLGVATPLCGVGLTWLVLRGAGALRSESRGDGFGALVLFTGALALVYGGRALAHNLDQPERYWMTVGFTLNGPRSLPAFDSIILQLGHALFPWSAVVPVAVARLSLLPKDLGVAERERSVALRSLCIIAPAVACVAYVLVAPVGGVLPFPAVAPLALVAAIALADFDAKLPSSAAFGMVVGALGIVLLTDFEFYPEKVLSAFVIAEPKFPESFRATSTLMLRLGTVLSLGLLLLCTLEEDEPERPLFDRASYAAWLRTVQKLWNGNLLFGVLAVEAALFGFVGVDVLSSRVPSLRQYFGLAGLSRSLARVGWVVPLALFLLPWVMMGARDCLAFLGQLRSRGGTLGLLPQRGALGLLSVVAFGGFLSLAYYPKLGAQISPKQAFSAYRRLSHGGEELGLLGASAGSASYYAGRSVASFDTPADAFEWLSATANRRWLLVHEGDLAELNAMFRAKGEPRQNLPVLDARSSEVFLVSNQLRPGEGSENPFSESLLDRLPRPAHPVDANLGGELDVLGWDVATLDGQLVSSVVPQKRYRFTTYYKVTQRIGGNWESFIHIDGFQRRFNGDHPVLAGKYPLRLFREGDIIADRYEFALEPNFTPGSYRVYFGLFSGERRMEVQRGRAEDNRIDGGTLRVE